MLTSEDIARAHLSLYFQRFTLDRKQPYAAAFVRVWRHYSQQQKEVA
jgi:hypothetical protein